MKKMIIKKGANGNGGPLEIEITNKKNKLLYVTGGNKPDIVQSIVDKTGLTPINGFKTTIPDNEIAAVVIDCGGALRCGIYPQKKIPTINIRNTGKSGPLQKYMTDDLYVSGVTKDKQVEIYEN